MDRDTSNDLGKAAAEWNAERDRKPVPSLTLYIIPSDDKKDPKETIKSFEGLATKVVLFDSRELHKIDEQESEWWCFMFDDEVIDKNLKDYLPVFLKDDSFDCFQLFKRVRVPVEGTKDKVETKFFLSPRVFKKGIKMQEGHSYMPVDVENLKSTRVLDGWIYGTDLLLL
jgi:hypothetical protein